jgi:hypothetical protein
MDHDDVLVREIHPGVERGDTAVPPPADPAQKDVRQCGPVEPERLFAGGGQVVGRHHGAEHRGDVKHVSPDGGDLRIGHGRVGGAEIHGAFSELPDAASGPDRLVVDANAGLSVVGIEPLGVDRIGEGRSGARERGSRRRWSGSSVIGLARWAIRRGASDQHQDQTGRGQSKIASRHESHKTLVLLERGRAPDG